MTEPQESSMDLMPQEPQIKPLPVVADGVDIEKMVENAQKWVKGWDTLRALAVQKTSPSDWIDEGGKPYLQWSGSSKIAMVFGVSYSPPVWEKETGKDDQGEFVTYRVSSSIDCKFIAGVPIQEIGTASTKDKFFGVRSGQRLPLSEVNTCDVQKKALTNLLNRGLKSRVGLSFTWDELKELSNGKISQNTVTGVEFKSGGRGGKVKDTKDTADYRGKIWDMLLELCGGSAEAAAKELETRTTYEWPVGSGTIIPGKTNIGDVSEKQLKFIGKDIEAKHKKMKNDK